MTNPDTVNPQKIYKSYWKYIQNSLIFIECNVISYSCEVLKVGERVQNALLHKCDILYTLVEELLLRGGVTHQSDLLQGRQEGLQSCLVSL